MLGGSSLGQLPLGQGGTYSYVPIDPETALFPFAATIISQYANSPILVKMIGDLTTYIDPTANLNAFYDLVWNIDTAQGWGLDVWGRIVDVGRVLQIPVPEYLGFEEEPNALNFNQGFFYTGSDSTSNFALADNAYRVLILAKALANITDGSIPSINQILINLFPNYGNVYVTDGLDMTMTYTFDLAPNTIDLAIVTSSGVLPKPTGVSFTVVHP